MKKKQAIALIAIILVVLFLAFGAIVYAKLNLINRNVEHSYATESQLFAEEVEAADIEDTMSASSVSWAENVDVSDLEGVTNILLIGQDKREHDSGTTRSDSMIVCSINGEDDSLCFTSLMRDMYVPIPGYQDNRLNAAYALGGMELLDQTVSQNFGIQVDGNIEVDLEGFVKTMATVGNIEVELNAEEAKYINENTIFGGTNDESIEMKELHEGLNSLDANQALAYARIRYIGNSDYERTERQRKLLTAAFENLKGMSYAELVSKLDDILPNFTTDMSNAQILKIAWNVAHSHIKGSYRLPVDGTYSAEVINGMQVLVPDLQANADAFVENINATQSSMELASADAYEEYEQD